MHILLVEWGTCAEKVRALCEQRVDAPVVGEEAGHVHEDRRRGQERLDHRPQGAQGERVAGGATRLVGAAVGHDEVDLLPRDAAVRRRLVRYQEVPGRAPGAGFTF